MNIVVTVVPNGENKVVLFPVRVGVLRLDHCDLFDELLPIFEVENTFGKGAFVRVFFSVHG